MDTLSRLEEIYQHAWKREEEILDRALTEGRENTPEEKEEIGRASAAMDQAKADADQLAAHKAGAKVFDELRKSMAPGIEAPETSKAPEYPLWVRNFDQTRKTGSLTEFEVPHSSAFTNRWNAANAALVARQPELRALQSAGGSAFETDFVESVVVYERTLNPVFQVARVLNTPRGNPVVLPRLTADPNHGGSVTAEATGINELDATISSVQLDSFKYAVVSLWSRELDQDEIIGLEDLIASSIGRELALDIGAAFTTGSGSGTPNGFITAATNGGTATGTADGSSTDTFFAPYDLIELQHTLAAPYRAVGTWMVSNSALTKIRGFRDANKNLMWDPGSLSAGQPPAFLGRPILENPSMAAVASASKSIAFGDFSRYVVRRMPLRVETSLDYKFSTDQVAIKVVERVDGDLVDTAAIAYLVSANT